jgi:hypothetical protein
MILSVPNYGTKGCQGIDMPDGTRYEAKNGKVEIDDPGHARQALRSGNAEFGAIAAPLHGFGDLQPGEKNCGCGFNAFRWQTSCPRCGADLPEEIL